MREQDTDDDDEDEEEGLILKEEDGTERWQRGEGEEDKMESGEYRKFSQIITSIITLEHYNSTMACPSPQPFKLFYSFTSFFFFFFFTLTKI